MDSYQLRATRTVIKTQSNGLVIVKSDFSRGADLRFKEDAFVLCAYLPHDDVELNQIAGRSSRTMKTHYCHVVCIDKVLDMASVSDWLKCRSSGQL